jgi:diguanylate cyclase (GGDEF)-like protein
LWNMAVRLGVFLVVADLVSEFRRLLTHQTELSRTDSLTGVLNRRAFHEAGDAEVNRMRRYLRPLTLAFMDIDNFKAVNDASGHRAGDALLVCVAQCLESQLRSMDLVSRLGGDEFAILFPETGQAGAQKALPRLRDSLQREMAASKWPVTFSIGVVTCTAAPEDMDHLVHFADQLMYAAKRRGKDCIEYASYPAGGRL